MTAWMALLLLTPLSRVEAQAQVDHTFRYDANALVKRVNLAGSFNGWNKTAKSMKQIPGTHSWVATLKLNPGKHTYKFVMDDER